jgi:hypothetical protein
MRRILTILAVALCVQIGCFDDVKTPCDCNPEEPPITTTEVSMLKPIIQTQNYFLREDNKLYSIDATNGMMEVDTIDVDGNPVELLDFFKSEGNLYFTIRTYEQAENPEYDPELLPEDEGYQPEFITVEVISY